MLMPRYGFLLTAFLGVAHLGRILHPFSQGGSSPRSRSSIIRSATACSGVGASGFLVEFLAGYFPLVCFLGGLFGRESCPWSWSLLLWSLVSVLLAGFRFGFRFGYESCLSDLCGLELLGFRDLDRVSLPAVVAEVQALELDCLVLPPGHLVDDSEDLFGLTGCLVSHASQVFVDLVPYWLVSERVYSVLDEVVYPVGENVFLAFSPLGLQTSGVLLDIRLALSSVVSSWDYLSGCFVSHGYGPEPSVEFNC